MVSDLFGSFQSLPSAQASTEFKAIPVSVRRKDFLAKSDVGAPVFLLHDAGVARYWPTLTFRYLKAQFQVTCAVATEDATQLTERFCLVSCDPDAPDLYELFVRCVFAAIEGLPTNSDTRTIESCILQLRSLFRSFASPSSREISGLWAELFVISNCTDIGRAITLWHEDQFDRFDFSDEVLRLEIKSSIRGIRVHDFALEQLEPPPIGCGAVASLLLQPLTSGVGVLDLARDIDMTLSTTPILKQKLWGNVASALGSDFSEKLDKRFDLVFAAKNLLLYDMRDIPAPERPSDKRITDVRFRANLSAVSSSIDEEPSTALARLLSQPSSA
ncbi:PD-(D/E)XK motif protein [Burkholderia gladioli]|uniref:PD-(D/E)XK motif protein n=1 Tax=Burkholderia gladioli TaxID=28095 RepID=UPI0034DAF774